MKMKLTDRCVCMFQAQLDHEEIVGGVQVLTAIANINQSIETGNVGMTFQALTSPDGHIMGLDQDCQEKYHKQLATARATKRKVSLIVKIPDMLQIKSNRIYGNIPAKLYTLKFMARTDLV